MKNRSGLAGYIETIAKGFPGYRKLAPRALPNTCRRVRTIISVKLNLGSLIIFGFMSVTACAADVSTYSFAGCAFPDTNQSVSYTATFGEDHDYASSVSAMSFTVYKVGVSSVTVDNRTGLMWVTNPRADAGFAGAQTWESALTSCTVTLNGLAYAGYTDWRLPNVRELMSIVDYGNYSPSINSTAFPGTYVSYYWTSTTYVPSTTTAWVVEFDVAYLGGGAVKTTNNYVRCVRGGP